MKIDVTFLLKYKLYKGKIFLLHCENFYRYRKESTEKSSNTGKFRLKVIIGIVAVTNKKNADTPPSSLLSPTHKRFLRGRWRFFSTCVNTRISKIKIEIENRLYYYIFLALKQLHYIHRKILFFKCKSKGRIL